MDKFHINISLPEKIDVSTVVIDEKLLYSTAEIADIEGGIEFSIFNWRFKNNAPLINIIELQEFFYNVVTVDINPVVLTLDMAPVLYAYRKLDRIYFVDHKISNDVLFETTNDNSVLSYEELAEIIELIAEQLHKLYSINLRLFLHIATRSYLVRQ